MMNRLDLSNYVSNKNGFQEKQYFCVVNPNNEGFTLENGEFDVLLDTLNSNEKFVLNIKDNANVRLSFFAKNELENLDVEINVYGNSELNIYFADFSYGTNKVNINIYLKEENCKANFHLASLTSKTDKKVFNISVAHEAKNTHAKVDNYGVCKDNSKLLFAGTSSINKGCITSSTYQSAKIMVFDQNCVATAKPILKIDENDIIANHAAVVGKVNDEHLFYLTSRGLSETTAKEIITFGYLKPILEGFVEDEVKEEITNMIEGRM